jgi:hypothetical protein
LFVERTGAASRINIFANPLLLWERALKKVELSFLVASRCSLLLIEFLARAVATRL